MIWLFSFDKHAPIWLSLMWPDHFFSYGAYQLEIIGTCWKKVWYTFNEPVMFAIHFAAIKHLPTHIILGFPGPIFSRQWSD